MKILLGSILAHVGSRELPRSTPRTTRPEPQYPHALAASAHDPRCGCDVKAKRIGLNLEPVGRRIDGELAVDGTAARVDANCNDSGARGFHMTIDLSWTEAGDARARRRSLSSGANQLRSDHACALNALAVARIGRMPGHCKFEVLR